MLIFLDLADVEMQHVLPLCDIFPLFVSIFTTRLIHLLVRCVKFESRFCPVNYVKFALFSTERFPQRKSHVINNFDCSVQLLRLIL